MIVESIHFIRFGRYAVHKQFAQTDGRTDGQTAHAIVTTKSLLNINSGETKRYIMRKFVSSIEHTELYHISNIDQLLFLCPISPKMSIVFKAKIAHNGISDLE